MRKLQPEKIRIISKLWFPRLFCFYKYPFGEIEKIIYFSLV